MANKNKLKQVGLKQLSLLKQNLERQELERLAFSRREYDEIIRYCTMLGYISHKKKDGKNVIRNGQPVFSSPSLNEQKKTIKIFNSNTHKYGYLQKLKNGIFYGYFKEVKGNKVFVPKYNFNANLNTLAIMLKLDKISIDRVKLACGIVELEC